MGVQGLWKLLECSGRPVNPETLEGKILAVDISIWLNQAIKGARDRQGNAIQNAHLLTLFHRLCKLLFFRIHPIFVFDGEAPLLKKQTLAKRRQKKDVAANEVKKTNDKLLRTFLKRQAIKAALSGNKQSNEFPSLSHIRRKEEEDIFALPPLEQNEKNSSEEEEEQEWEERMSQKQILQEEFFANPHSVDVDSEEFHSLPPEMKHEILTDMKEFTKRRRTLFEAMPEGSDDFSQYQLKGLLKKNNLNRCLDNVRKEMSQQHSGEVRAQFETEGGFMKEVETNRLVSEDTSHYILIKGIQSKTPDKKEEPVEQAVATSSDAVPKTYLDFKMASAHKSKKVKDSVSEATAHSVPEATPPSPRTLFAIQEAMLENSSDEETDKMNSRKQMSRESVYAVDGDVSPRTLHAIQQALSEDEVVVNKKRTLNIKDDEEQPRSKVLIISSSDEEDVALVSEVGKQMTPVVSLARANISHSPDSQHTSADNEKLLGNIPVCNQKQIEPLEQLNVSQIKEVSSTAFVEKSNLSHSTDALTEPCLTNLPSSAESSSVVPFLALERHQANPPINREISILISPKKQSNNQTNVEAIAAENERKLQTSDHERIGIQTPEASVSAPASQLSADHKLSSEVVAETSNATAVVLVEQDVSDSIASNTGSHKTSDVPDATYVPMTPESIPDRDKGMDSESDGSFVEVESDSEDGNSQLVHRPELPSDDIAPKAMSRESVLADASQSSGINLEDSITAKDQDVVPQQAEGPRDEEDASHEWQDISAEELEVLESNLFVQQTSLQAQKQQQERVAASVTGQMYLESQELLRLFGIPYIVAPMEAEAQCAVLDLTDQTSGTITDDSDIWLFGARHVYKNFFSHNKYVEYYQFSDIQNQLGLDRHKLINLAYLMGSDYTEGIPSVGYVSAMEVLNEFPGHGLESLLKFKEWWTEAQANKKMRPNPNDTKVKKKLRDLELHPGFPNKAVADAYLKPVVDDSQGAFSWGRPDLEQIRKFCESRFGWYRSKTDDVLLPVLKQLNTQQSQPRIDSFFHVEQQETHVLKSQRLRRAVTCMKRKEKDSNAAEVEEATTLMEQENSHGDHKGSKANRNSKKSQRGKKKNKAETVSSAAVYVEGGFISPANKTFASPEKKTPIDSDGDRKDTNTGAGKQKGPNTSRDGSANVPVTAGKVETSSSSEDEEMFVQVSAKPVFQGNKRKPRSSRGRRR
ncbi:DNA excision repair protein ERCC-5 [Hyperolius riggenbachi]|uniref:DNA excision repair protein ERCC-5 n=1 Tax=Hyperolius riggenbachi TaxID=752182 RepID=UPI0035A37206